MSSNTLIVKRSSINALFNANHEKSVISNMTLFDRLGCVAQCFDSFNTRNALQVSCYCEQIFKIRCDFQFCAMFVAKEILSFCSHARF
jgi:hypothetical protein